MNEITFILHIAALMSFVLLALRMGKEALIAALAIQVILANLFVMKQMECFGLHVTCADVYTVGSIFSMNLIQVYFGKKVANRALKAVFFLLFLVMVMSQFQLRYVPSKYDGMHHAFAAILNDTPRIMIFSFLSALIAQKMDMELFGWIRKKLPKTPLFLPFALSSLVTQGFDTLFFSYTALYGIVHSMRDIIVMSYLIKVIIIFCVAPFTFFVKKWIHHDPVQV
ncbi:MAG: queuosine precursor transporter [Chlamydiia bacterium]|nr:queuosine precursor transporter [Chlamydiia bacterium]